MSSDEDDSNNSSSGSEAETEDESEESQEDASESSDEEAGAENAEPKGDSFRLELGGKPVILTIFRNGNMKIHLDKRSVKRKKPTENPTADISETDPPLVERPHTQKSFQMFSGRFKVTVNSSDELIHVRFEPPLPPASSTQERCGCVLFQVADIAVLVLLCNHHHRHRLIMQYFPLAML